MRKKDRERKGERNREGERERMCLCGMINRDWETTSDKYEDLSKIKCKKFKIFQEKTEFHRYLDVFNRCCLIFQLKFGHFWFESEPPSSATSVERNLG